MELKDIIALAALFVAVFSIGIGAWQADRTVHASVQPLLDVEFTESLDEKSLIIHNYGMGPAVITNVTFYKDGLESAYIRDFFHIPYEAPFATHKFGSGYNYIKKDGDIILAKILLNDLKSKNYTDDQIKEIGSAWAKNVIGVKVEIAYKDTLGRKQENSSGTISRPEP